MVAIIFKGIPTSSVKRQQQRHGQRERQILGMDLGQILERYHRLTLAA